MLLKEWPLTVSGSKQLHIFSSFVCYQFQPVVDFVSLFQGIGQSSPSMSFPVLNSSLPVPNQQQQLHTSIDHHQQYLVSDVIAKAQVKAIAAFRGSINNLGNMLPTNDISGTDGQVRDVGIKQLFPPSLQQWSRMNDRTCYVIVFIFFYIFCSLRNSLVLTSFQFNNLLMYLHICLSLILCTAIY